MQKIVIDNFGPISHAELELTPLVVLIGEQASGKSTIAKLVYFFKSLGDEFLVRYYQSEKTKIDYTHHVIMPIREKFYDMFGSTFHLPKFDINYFYNEERSISLSLDERKKLNVRLSDGFFSNDDVLGLKDYKTLLVQLNAEIIQASNIAEKISLEERRTRCLHQIADKVNSIFCNEHNDSLYIIAGRNAMVGYSETFEKMLSIHIQRNIENRGKRAFEIKEQTIDETLMLDFMQKVTSMRQVFNKLGDFEGMISLSPNKKQSELKCAYDLVKKVVKGSYSSSEYGERIIVHDEEKRYVYLKDASSGQQESIRILQDSFLSIYTDNNVFRIIEEPEAHLYPESQMYLLQLLSVMLNHNGHNQLIITTHSPYVLSVVNNMMYAYLVGEKHPEAVRQLIGERSWLNPSKVRSYMLGNGQVENVVDKDLQMIKAEKIDNVSEVLNDQFDKLLNLENKDE